jgi:NADP-dependent 3-hydroxy acid dehydrogenase YdfG
MFTDQTALVTGASSGIGRAIALGLAAQGATLCLVGRNETALEAVADDAQAASPRVLCYQGDLTLDGDIHRLTTHLQHAVGRLDILVHSAGGIALGKLETAPVEDFDWQYRINVRAPYVLTQALLPLLKPVSGQIVFINSTVGLTAKANISQYAASKHALKALADSLRDEVNGDGIRVLSIFLGRTASAMQQAVYEEEERTYHPELLLQPADVAGVVIYALSLPRTAEVTEISMRPLLKSY